MNKKLKKLIDDSDIVSFDIFDTLIYRIVPKPKDIAYMVEETFNKHHNGIIKDFHAVRINAENLARKKSNKEITIDYIYNEIRKILVISDTENEELKKIELEIEKEVCYLNDECKEIIQYCNENEKKVIVTSDMYLNAEFLSEILKKTNLKYEKIFVSSEIGLKKSDGKLFDYIIKKLNIERKKIVHIGDNFKSDYINAKKSGLKAYWLKRTHCKKVNNYKEYLLEKYIDELSKKNDENNKYFEFGYQKLGIMMYGFCNYIKNNIIRNNTDKVIFLAREGKFIKECYDLLDDTDIDKHYFYVSRKSISSAIIKESNAKDIDEVINLQSLALNETVEMFLKRFNLLTEENRTKLKENNIELSSDFYKESNKIKELFKTLIDNTDQNKDLFKEYLEQFHFSDKTAIVDIGWNGTMQDLIQKELDYKNITINGYYLGVREKRKNPYKHGYMFDGDNRDMEICSRSMVAFLEILFSANHGTTLGYKFNGKIEPVLDNLEIEEKQMDKILQIQSGAQNFLKDYKDSYICKNINFEDDMYYKYLIDIGTEPSRIELDLFNDFMIFNEKSKKLIGGKSVLFYMFHFKEFKNDFLDSGWKIAFLKNVFKIKLPYKKIYEFIYKIRK